MFKTPANERKRRSVISESDAMKTPVGGLGTSVVEPSMLNTPEEPGNESRLSLVKYKSMKLGFVELNPTAY